jgi:hypothetical protein
MEIAMPQAAHLFTVTRWLINAAMIICIGVLALLILAIGAVTMAAVGAIQIPIPADFTEGVGLAAVLGASAMAITAGAICVALYALVLMLIGRIVDSANAGDPFVAKNATRLNTIGGLLLALEAVGFIANAVIAAMPHDINKHLHLGFGMSMSGLFAALLVFVLAQIFQRGSEMRAELEGTV